MTWEYCEQRNERRYLRLPGTGNNALQPLEESNTLLFFNFRGNEQFDCLGQVDPLDDSAPIDIHTLSEKLEFKSSEVTFVDGHLSHFLEGRCNCPFALQSSISARTSR